MLEFIPSTSLSNLFENCLVIKFISIEAVEDGTLSFVCFVITDSHLGKTKSLTSISSPDAVHRLPFIDDTFRREKKNAENSNIRNVADKYSNRQKVASTVRIKIFLPYHQLYGRFFCTKS